MRTSSSDCCVTAKHIAMTLSDRFLQSGYPSKFSLAMQLSQDGVKCRVLRSLHVGHCTSLSYGNLTCVRSGQRIWFPINPDGKHCFSCRIGLPQHVLTKARATWWGGDNSALRDAGSLQPRHVATRARGRTTFPRHNPQRRHLHKRVAGKPVCVSASLLSHLSLALT